MIWGTPHFRKPARLCAAACFCALALQDGPFRTLIVFCLISDCRICGWWMVDLKHQQFSFWPHELRYVFFFITRLPWLVISYHQSTAQIAQPLAQKGSCWNDKMIKHQLVANHSFAKKNMICLTLETWGTILSMEKQLDQLALVTMKSAINGIIAK